MRSKDILKQEFKEEIQKALQSTDEGAMADAFINLIENASTSNSSEEGVVKQSMKINSIKENGIKAAKMSKSDFKRKFGAKDGMSFTNFAQQVLLKNGDIKQEIQKRTDGSVIAPIGISADIIYNACQKSVLLNNCPIVPMETGTVRIGKIDEDMELDFKERGAVGKNTSLGLKPVDLVAKTLYGYVEVAEEDIQDVYQIENILMKAFSDAVAKALDNNFLYTNSNASTKEGVYPNGIMDNVDIKKIQVSSVDYDMVAKARLEISKENGEPDTIGINPNELYSLQILKDSTGQYIQTPVFYGNLTQIESNGLKPKHVLVMDSNAVAVGIRNQIDFKVMNDIKKGTILMRVMVRADVLPIRENHICKIEIVES
ncbi:phage major capsid protein [Clostridium sp. Marseille-Q2269]|uniref:phage major capsid protein n=1 Tax=Clostridium sp. Marseille-Q2269 TaxID=2942205 RepID=UPI002072D57E|nr:phage major capsid protein [Clostridium sp. Marseille-Q2269]